ncbi:hypothetical protein BU26DRAFT_569046 [Trematosphaeria pertusa]|uniref:Uncharacterized protein n=1 Tax=Trematosphaeria pertusa TaxID=390896 RepID=A0A6A6I181_9PLEO|nr:uncharacterized protein BU26DRAFT_569046 [Trematosphaeria pertusa]KAF2244037.1 hypothetical protein BU26DRAFT_569046 [Trematosphaeria pertusa]
MSDQHQHQHQHQLQLQLQLQHHPRQHHQPSAAASSFPPPSASLRSTFAHANIHPLALHHSASAAAADGRPKRPALVTRASENSPSSPARPRPRPRRSVLSKSSSAVPTLSTTSIPRALPTYWLPSTMTTATGAGSTAADLLRQAMMQR